ncbi:MAG: hypothetical protein EOP35_25985 [Rubrivivax sp.]|nr:MAG: hypothetical protein EOP35_25985 [Rubrivivax sp.]
MDGQGRTNYVRGKAVETITEVGLISEDKHERASAVEKQLGAFVVSEVDIQGPEGKPDACMTRVAKWQPREPLVETRNWQSTDEGILIDTTNLHVQTVTLELSAELASPQWIDWRNVKIARAVNGGQMTASFANGKQTLHFAFSGESELIDRVEYAMKFLKMSCDDTAATGF